MKPKKPWETVTYPWILTAWSATQAEEEFASIASRWGPSD